MNFDFASFYDERFKEQLSSISPYLSRDLGRASELPESDAERLVALILELACQCQNSRNITLGREAAVESPRQWLLGRIERVAERILDLNDEWEYRRFLEVSELLDPHLLSRIVLRGLMSRNTEIVETANEYRSQESG